MGTIQRRFNYELSGFYFIALFLLAILGFWPSYFAKFFDGTADFSFYFHFHAFFAVIWITLLIVQPILIRRKKLALHRLLGKVSYLVIPMIFISVLLLSHHTIAGEEGNLGASFWVTFKDLIVLGTAYGIAIRYRKSTPIHARGMIAAGIVLIEPALIRFILYAFFPSGFSPVAYLITIALVYSVLITLIIMERKQKKGRWVFPLILGLYLLVHSVLVFQLKIPLLEAFAQWFAALPLTS